MPAAQTDLRLKLFTYDKLKWPDVEEGFVYDLKHAIPEESENIQPRFNDYDAEIVNPFYKASTDEVTYLGVNETNDELALSTGWYYLENQAHYLFSDEAVQEVGAGVPTTIEGPYWTANAAPNVDQTRPIVVARYRYEKGTYLYDHSPSWATPNYEDFVISATTSDGDTLWVDYTADPGPVFILGEKVTGSTSLAIGRIVRIVSATEIIIELDDPAAPIEVGETISGNQSFGTGTVGALYFYTIRTDIFTLFGNATEVFQSRFFPPFFIELADVAGVPWPDPVTITAEGYIEIDNPGLLYNVDVRVTYWVGLSATYEVTNPSPATVEVSNTIYDSRDVASSGIDENELFGNSILCITNTEEEQAKQIKISHPNAIDVISSAYKAGEILPILIQTLSDRNDLVPFSSFCAELALPVGTINGWHSKMTSITGSNGQIRINYVAPLQVADLGIPGTIDGANPNRLILSLPINKNDGSTEPLANTYLLIDDGTRFTIFNDGSDSLNYQAVSATDVLGQVETFPVTPNPFFDWNAVAKVTFPAALPAGDLYLVTSFYNQMIAKLCDENGLQIPGTRETSVNIYLKLMANVLRVTDHSDEVPAEGRVESVFYLDVVTSVPASTVVVPTSINASLLANSAGLQFFIRREQAVFEPINGVGLRFIIEN